ncbi:alkaline phosphatase family protein [Sphingobacterium spiritivorum]|uniref:alkaline phosphatase family protein n=1 Tax=Sphingobacterium spiritivorum TaxID=258 RepID=UPI003DA22769
MKSNRITKFLLMLMLLVAGLTSCKKYFDPPLVFEKEVVTPFVKERKVLMIVVDGLSGIELKKDVPTNIKALLPNSKYSFNALADANTGDASTWTTIVSGVGHNKHGIEGDDFDEEFDEDDPHGTNNPQSGTGFVTFFQRILESGKTMKSYAVTPNALISKNLFGLADGNVLVSSDAAAKDSILSKLGRNETDLGVAVVNFRSVNEAGVKSSFSMSSAMYKDAVTVADGYIGEILTGLKKRKDYAKEDWLVIITSNHGGSGNTYGGASLEERKVPVIYYSPNIVGKEFEIPDLKNSLTVNAINAFNPTILNANAGQFNVGNTGDYTIMCKVKVITKSGTNSVIVGKTTHAYSATRGWHLMIASSENKFRAILGDGTLYFVYSPKTFVIGQWHTIAIKVYTENGKRYGRVYQDGEPGAAVDVTGKNITGTGDFFVGPGKSGVAYGASSNLVNNLAYYNVNLPDQYIKDFACKQELDATDTYWNQLVGYWPMGEGSGSVLKNRKDDSGKTDFLFPGSPFAWNLAQSWSCSTEENPNIYLTYDKDLMSNILYWLKIPIVASWNLEGTPWLQKYETEFIK